MPTLESLTYPLIVMKRIIFPIFFLAALAGCRNQTLETANVQDLGVAALPNGYTAHGFEIRTQNGNIKDHIYLVERKGTVVAGASAIDTQDKAAVSATTILSTESK